MAQEFTKRQELLAKLPIDHTIAGLDRFRNDYLLFLQSVNAQIRDAAPGYESWETRSDALADYFMGMITTMGEALNPPIDATTRKRIWPTDLFTRKPKTPTVP